uniref:Transmembrane protein n=1 Tax=Nelumbo nucifera TaxID=4432 RepID=A0A822ZPG8_NELNU|nr:TPA_asm: hypothetical protein HUJ06_001918 [Nelumbo nucifera]
MGYVVVISLPFFILLILLSFGCYILGRDKGRKEGRMLAAQEFGINVVPPGVVAPGVNPVPSPPEFSSVPPPQFPSYNNPHPTHMKQGNETNI